MKITNYELKITSFSLQVKKLLLLLLPLNIHIILGQKNQQFFLNRITGKPTMVAAWKLSAVMYAQRMDVKHTYGGLSIIAILTTMLKVKNYFDYVIGSEAGLTDFQLLTLLQEGGEL